MTALRPDGHLRPPHDCLHYQLPSVVDWWHHLLITLLADARTSGPRGEGGGRRSGAALGHHVVS